MITGILTFLIIFAVIGSILYGQRLIKTEKSDAVFGNPERAKGGVHWIIVGTSFLLFTWLYYSWDIAKAFYPKSANELCQVAKVNESLLSLKYLFPIEERSHKSTALIKRENINITNKINRIQNSDLKEHDKEKFIKLLNKTRQTIPLLTNEKYLETESQNTINELTKKINLLAEKFPKDNYPPALSEEEENKRIEALKKQLGWGATGMEVPPLPESKVGLKFHVAAQELNMVSDEFFAMRNHNPEYLSLLNEIRDEIKEYKDGLNDEQELEMIFIKEIKKLGQRIEYESIFPPSALDDMEIAIRNFDDVQKKEQGSIRIKDMILFPGGTIVASGPTCAEDGRQSGCCPHCTRGVMQCGCRDQQRSP